ncbi:hypothetical protein A500_19264 [Clostridium sartagoforme AAU1]|uniref:Uncharacterized protein n=1 Tax=Clostridium sartagoforme AAU1 TaxID=1202534 RepID=R9BSD9_9CLOT|nr:hypothetical protein [Clostridium sartagoforme]EOR19983.1 hypothetical protein A500_19264 [Clostridium sartagoforme AAU1]
MEESTKGKDFFQKSSYEANTIKEPEVIISVIKEKEIFKGKATSAILEEIIMDYCERQNISCFDDSDFYNYIKSKFDKFFEDLSNGDLKSFALMIQMIKNEIYKDDLINRTRDLIDIIFLEKKIPEKRRMLKTLTFNKNQLRKFYEDLLTNEKLISKYIKGMKDISKDFEGEFGGCQNEN